MTQEKLSRANVVKNSEQDLEFPERMRPEQGGTQADHLQHLAEGRNRRLDKGFSV